ncbi:MAG: hypothetical protein E7328_03475, partial [Clostridiales bacterium]|nr:hypothetical protein [Clostridiales bacterium]
NEYDDRYVVESQGRVQYAMGPHAEYTCTPEFLAYCAKYAKERGWRLHIHCSETAKEHAECIERHGKTPVALFESLGMLDVPALFAHCVYITEEDMEILARHGAAVCHCPESNLKLGSGIAPVVKMREKGVLVGIGTDGAASNNDLDMLSECRTAALLQKGANRDAAAITAFEALKMATVDGRKALGVEGGPILEGEVADLILLDVQKAHLTPFGDDPYAAVLYGAKSSDVVLTMVDGNVLYRDGEWKTLCMETIAQEVKRVREGLLSR